LIDNCGGERAVLMFDTLIVALVSAAVAATSTAASGAWTAVQAWAARRHGRVAGLGLAESSDAHTVDPLVERIDLLRAQLSESAQLLPVLQAELELRVAALDRLQADAVHYEKLASVKQEEAEAVQRLVEQTVGRGLAETARRGGRQQALYFASGLAASIPLGVLANILYSWVTR
jgi:hypothetical protein